MRFTDLLQSAGVPYVTEGKHCRAGWVNMDCPHCGPGSGKMHLGYNLSAGYLHCWKCGKQKLVETVALLTRSNWNEAARLLDGLEIVERRVKQPTSGKLVLPQGVEDMQPAHRAYLRNRGFNPGEIRRLWGVQGIGICSRLSWRLFIPIYLGREVVSWTTRSISHTVERRYISAAEDEEAVSHKTLLYGEAHCGMAVCAVEGPIDAWRGGYGFVALCGTAYSRAQVGRLAKYLVRGVWFDKEPEAQKRAKTLVNELSAFPGETFLINGDSKDPGMATEREVGKVRKALGIL